jgi:hypothetical protein
MTKSVNEYMLDQMRWGFWIRTKQDHRAVRWEDQRHEDGRQSFRGRNWVEVLPHDDSGREPERFFGADVELAGPYQRLSYYPAHDEPVCGWQEAEWRAAGEYCPRVRERQADGELEPFCRKHMTELQGEETHDGNSPVSDPG